MILKYADDTAIVGFLNTVNTGNENSYITAVSRFVQQCDKDDLRLNVMKTKEMVIDFRKESADKVPLSIKGQEIEAVSSYKYLGITIQDNLKWDKHVHIQCKRASARIYHLRKLREFRVNTCLQQLFYSATIESILFFGITVWGGSCTSEDSKKLRRVQRTASKVMHCEVDSWGEVYRTRCVARANKIRLDTSHPLHDCYERLPSGRRLRVPRARTERHRRTFIPSSIRLMNSSS